MGLTKCESKIYEIPYPVEFIYSRYEDLRNFELLRKGLDTPEFKEKLKQENVSEDKVEDLKKKLENVEFTADSITIPSSFGQFRLVAVEKEAPKLIKLATENSPMQLFLWIQFLPISPNACKIKVTTGADVNIIMKAMVKKPLQQAAEGIARMLAGIPPQE